ncbi:TonB-dependent receptor domain-containing protein [Comamonas sp. JC664]|uniref:TonB-dependent receptor domain-containing protein n=1 Tax=Comamonas sp. JC664 TaxID=2801917 RepID=UPI00360F963C
MQREDGRPTNGFLPAYGTITDTPYGRIDRRLNAGEPGVDHLKRTQSSLGWLLSHQINSDWKFTQNYKYTHLDLDQVNTFAYGSDGDGRSRALHLHRWHLQEPLPGQPHHRQAQAVRQHPAAAHLRIDYLKSDTDGLNNGFGFVPGLDMFNPVYGAPFDITGTPYGLHSKQWGAYASTQLRVGSHWNFKRRHPP